MKIIGLTGGIGSGKTTVAGFFKELNVPTYTSDIAAKEIMVSDKDLVANITKLLGEEAYTDGELNRSWIADQVFNNDNLLAALNALVHPAVALDFKKWTRINRVMKRDHTTREKVIARMDAQWSDVRKQALSDASIENIILGSAQKRVLKLHKHILRRIELGW